MLDCVINNSNKCNANQRHMGDKDGCVTIHEGGEVVDRQTLMLGCYI